MREILGDLKKEFDMPQVHDRKEIENYLLDPIVLGKAIETRMAERTRRTGEVSKKYPDISRLLMEITTQMKPDVAGQYVARRAEFLKKKYSSRDLATVTAECMRAFEADWCDVDSRLRIVPGKQVMALLNKRLQDQLGLSISVTQVASQFESKQFPQEISRLIKNLQKFSELSTPD